MPWVLEVKLAVTVRSPVRSLHRSRRRYTTHHSSPGKVDPLAAVALSVTLCPWVKEALHVVGQLIPAGLLVTVPLPVPTLRHRQGGRGQIEERIAIQSEIHPRRGLDATYRRIPRRQRTTIPMICRARKRPRVCAVVRYS